MTHDLHVSAVFLLLWSDGMNCERWLYEDRLPKSWPIEVRPDARSA